DGGGRRGRRPERRALPGDVERGWTVLRARRIGGADPWWAPLPAQRHGGEVDGSRGVCAKPRGAPGKHWRCGRAAMADAELRSAGCVLDWTHGSGGGRDLGVGRRWGSELHQLGARTTTESGRPELGLCVHEFGRALV